MTHKKFPAESGFGIIEIMVTIGLLAVVSLGVQSLLKNMHLNLSEADRQVDIQGLNSQILHAIADKNSCTANLRLPNNSAFLLNPTDAALSIPRKGQKIGVVLPDDNNTLLTEGSRPSGFSKIQIDSLVLRDLKAVPNTAGAFTANIYAQVKPVNLQTGTLTIYRERTVSTIYLNVKTDNSILSCYGTGTDLSSICTSINGIWDQNTQTCSSDLAAQCAQLGGTWANGKCQLTVDPATVCQGIGGTWTGSYCVTQLDPNNTCTKLGETMVNGKCTPDPATVCSTLGETMVNGKCTPDPATVCSTLGESVVNGKCVPDPATVCSTLGESVVNGKCVPDPALSCATLGGTWGGGHCLTVMDAGYACNTLGGTMQNGKCSLGGGGSSSGCNKTCTQVATGQQEFCTHDHGNSICSMQPVFNTICYCSP